MQLARELAERLLDLGVARGARDAEQLVVVPFGRGHRSSVPRRSVLLVGRLDEPRELVGGGPDGADRLLVVHPDRAEQADRAERARRQPIGGADEGDVVQPGVIEARRGRTAAAASNDSVISSSTRGALLEHGEKAAAGLELVRTDVVEQRGGAADVQRLRRRRGQIDERGPQGIEELALPPGQARIVEPAAQLVRADPDAGEPLVQVLVRPGREARVDPPVEA